METLQTAVVNTVVVWCTSREGTKDNQGRKTLFLCRPQIDGGVEAEVGGASPISDVHERPRGKPERD